MSGGRLIVTFALWVLLFVPKSNESYGAAAQHFKPEQQARTVLSAGDGCLGEHKDRRLSFQRAALVGLDQRWLL